MFVARALTSKLVVIALPLCASSSLAQETSAEAAGDSGGTSDVSQVGKIGRMHDNIRRAQQRESLSQEISGYFTDYANWKAAMERETDTSYSMGLSLLEQWGSPDGGSPSLQIVATPAVDWTLFRSSSWGTGSIQLAYNWAGYVTSQNAADIQTNLGLITPINDYPTKTHNFAQFTYTQATPNNKWLFTIGQFPLYNFDGNAYLANQQENFNNFLFAQNGSEIYLLTGLGGYIQYNVTSTIQLAGGFQSANNVSGINLSTQNFSSDCCTVFGYVQWTPNVPSLGSAQYSISYFDTPSIPTQGATRNWSVNAVQSLNKTWALFARANGANGYVGSIKDSYVLGVAMNNPLSRATTDQIALAVGRSVAASPPTHPPNARDESPIEVYWTWTFFGALLFTPSVQYVVHPALNPAQNGVWAWSLRLTQAF